MAATKRDNTKRNVRKCHEKRAKMQREMAGAGFEPAPFQTSALNWRLRPLGQPTIEIPTPRKNIHIPTHTNEYKTSHSHTTRAQSQSHTTHHHICFRTPHHIATIYTPTHNLKHNAHPNTTQSLHSPPTSQPFRSPSQDPRRPLRLTTHHVTLVISHSLL